MGIGVVLCVQMRFPDAPVRVASSDGSVMVMI